MNETANAVAHAAHDAPAYIAFIQAYLFGWTFWMTITLGFFALTLLHHTVRGSWGLPILRLLEAGNKMLLPMGIAFAPIVIFLFLPDGHYLYHWLHPGEDVVLQRKAFYLNLPFFVIRQVIYFGSWTILAMILNNSSRRQDQNGDEREAQYRTNIAAPGLVWFVLSVTAAYTDWVMSLDPHWFSTIFPAWFVVGMGLSCFAMSMFIVARRASQGQQPWKDIITYNRGFLKDMGNFMLAFTMLWAYFSLSQLLIIWSGNLPEETTYYVVRTSGIWLYIGTGLLGLQFVVPLLCLLSGRTKRTPSYLMSVAALIFTMRIVDMSWTVIPFFGTHDHPAPADTIIFSLAAFAIVGAVWLLGFGAFQKGASPVPTHDPRLEEIIAEGKGGLSHA
jgi:hypothetical protein